MHLRPIKLKQLETPLRDKRLTKPDVGTLPTLRYPVANLHPELPIPVKKSTKRRTNYRHVLYVGTRQFVYAAIAITLGILANYYLTNWTVYRVVAFVVLGILWSNVASSAARRSEERR